MGRYAKKNQEKVFERNKTCWLQSQDGGQCRWTVGAAVPRKKGNKEWSRGIDPLATKLERTPTARGSWGQVQPNKNVEAKENRQVDWRVSTGPLTWNLRGLLNVKPVVDNMRP